VNELVVSKNSDGLRIALLKDKMVLELHHERIAEEFAVGDLVLGRVRKIVPGLNAAFVDAGHTRDAFLHYFDLGPQIRSLLRYLKAAQAGRGRNPKSLENLQPLPDIDKHGKMADVLKANQTILVQIVKEPISTKGPRLSSEISIPGQYAVLVPFSNSVTVSKKVKSSAERKRLRVLGESLKPKNFGMIIRTAAEGKDAATLGKDISNMVAKWDLMTENLARAKAPVKVLSEQSRTQSILRDMLSQGFDAILTDDKETHQEIHDFLEANQPEHLKILKLVKGRLPLFHQYGIEKQIKAAFGKIVTLNQGSYLVIEHTEAMHVIDVNSGSKNLSNTTLEETALRVNMEAATEIARLLRLRDLGGIIVIDFIDLRRAENRKKLIDHFRAEMKEDRAKHSVLSMSKFGLVQITRQRVRPQLDITTTEVCPSCNGSGKMSSTILLADEISNNVDFLMKQNKEKQLRLVVNPYVATHLKYPFLKSARMQWFRKYWVWVKIDSDPTVGFTSVHYFNGKEEEIKF
jgi:ribonuclease G